MGVTKCIVCLSSVKPSLKFTVQHSFEEQLIITFLLRKLLLTPIPGGTFARYLKSFGNPSDWIALCHICEKQVKDALESQRQIMKMIRRVHEVRRKLYAENVSESEEEVDGSGREAETRTSVFHSVRRDYKGEKWKSKNLEKSLNLRLIGESIETEGSLHNDNQAEENNEESIPVKAELISNNDMDYGTAMQDEVDDFFNDEEPWTSRDLAANQELANNSDANAKEVSDTDMGSIDSDDSMWGPASKKRKNSEPKRKKRRNVIKPTANSPKYVDIPGVPLGTKTCPICEKTFANGSSMRRHYKGTHIQSKNHHCPHCSLSFLRKEYLQRHILSCHSESGPVKENQKGGEHQCPRCPMKFLFRAPLRRHIRRVHLERTKYFSCDLCEKTFRRKDYLMAHVNDVHKKHDVNADPDLSDVENRTCKFCKLVCTSLGVLSKHIKEVHEKIKEFMCNICSKGFTRKNDMHRHIHAQHMTADKKKRIPCTVCGKEILGEVCLAKHMKRQHKQKQNAKCKICNRSYAQLASLHIHMMFDHNAKGDSRVSSNPEESIKERPENSDVVEKENESSKYSKSPADT